MTRDSESSVMEELRQSVASLLKPDFANLQNEIEQLEEQLRQLEALSNPLPEDLQNLQVSLQRLLAKIESIKQNVSDLHGDLENPQKVTNLIKLGLYPALQQSIEDAPDQYGEAIAPVISPAIRNQIRNSREEMIEALSPIIGQTISKAIREAFQDFRRRIDAQLKQNLNFNQQIKRIIYGAQGISAADMMIRESFPYTITHIFLIQQQTGLLLKQVSQQADQQDMDLISGMLTAIRDFAGDAFGYDESELEEIQYGDSHILLKGGRYAYLAAVVEGIQPSGYVDLLGRAVHELNIKHEKFLRNFQGDMSNLPDFNPELSPLLNPGLDEISLNSSEAELNRGQKIALWASLGGLVACLALAIFGCVFSIRLMPAAFPPATFTQIPVTFTPVPTGTFTPKPSATATSTFTPIPSATQRPTQMPFATIESIIYNGVTTGNVWSHQNPDPNSKRIPIAILVNTKVELKAIYNDWVKIIWETEFGTQEGWIPLKYLGIVYPLPSELVTPVE